MIAEDVLSTLPTTSTADKPPLTHLAKPAVGESCSLARHPTLGPAILVRSPSSGTHPLCWLSYSTAQHSLTHSLE
jgi:hypothetical protein